MAKKISAITGTGGETRKRAKERAEALFVRDEPEEDEAPKAKAGKTVRDNTASEADMRRWFVLIQAQERDYEKVLAEIRSKRQDSKGKLDKIYADAADAMKSRNVTKRVLKALWELSRRDDDEVASEYAASVWAMRAAGMPLGAQLSFWDERLDDPADAYNRAMSQGKTAGLQGVGTEKNPHNGHQLLSQAWMEGWHSGQGELVMVGSASATRQ